MKDNNIKFYENYYHKEKINGITHKIFESVLSYEPICCPKCGVVFDENFEKHGFITYNIKLPNVSGFKTILRLKKQRYLCKHCNKVFALRNNVTQYGCFISNNTKHQTALDLTKKCFDVDIAKDNNVSANTVERVMDSFYKTQKLYKDHLPEVLLFDEFKSVKSIDGAMSFHLCDGVTGKTIDIAYDRKLLSLLKYLGKYSHKALKNVKYIVIDMYSPYVSLIKKMFPNANIVIDNFHLTQFISRSLNKTRINIMKKDKKNYNKLILFIKIYFHLLRIKTLIYFLIY